MIRKSSIPQAIVALALAIAISAIGTALGNDGSRIVQIRSRVTCNTEKVHLSDFVQNPEMLSDTELALEIIETPKDSPTRRISLIGLAYMLQRYQQLHDLQLSGPRMILVERAASPEFLNKAKAAILNYVEATPPWRDWKVDVIFSAGDSRQIGAVGPFSKVKVLTVDSRDRLGTVKFQVGFYDDDESLIKQLTIHPQIVREVNAVVMQTNRSRGHILSHDDVELVPTWQGNGRMDAVIDINKVVGRELNRSRQSGDIIRARDLLKPMGAKRGDVIWVTAINGTLSVRISAHALDTGRVGEQIRVKNPSSNKIFAVKLTGQKEAVVQL